MNSIENTGNIKFRHEEETNKSIAFFDIKIHHKEDGSIKIQIYRRPTHTDQYLLRSSEHPTAHKPSVVRTLYDRSSVITDEADRKEEDTHIKHVLTHCQYPRWAIEKRKQQARKTKNKRAQKKGQTQQKRKTQE